MPQIEFKYIQISDVSLKCVHNLRGVTVSGGNDLFIQKLPWSWKNRLRDSETEVQRDRDLGKNIKNL